MQTITKQKGRFEMKTYFIDTYRKEETEKVVNCLLSYDIKYKINSSIMHYETVRFECDKATWKSIKKDLGLEVKSVFADLRV